MGAMSDREYRYIPENNSPEKIKCSDCQTIQENHVYEKIKDLPKKTKVVIKCDTCGRNFNYWVI